MSDGALQLQPDEVTVVHGSYRVGPLGRAVADAGGEALALHADGLARIRADGAASTLVPAVASFDMGATDSSHRWWILIATLSALAAAAAWSLPAIEQREARHEGRKSVAGTAQAPANNVERRPASRESKRVRSERIRKRRAAKARPVRRKRPQQAAAIRQPEPLGQRPAVESAGTTTLSPPSGATATSPSAPSRVAKTSSQPPQQSAPSAAPTADAGAIELVPVR